MKALYIEKCSDSMMWYAKCIGQVVPFIREESDCYLSREPAGYTNIVLKQDARIIDVELQHKTI